jgi:hypothetical protein
VNRIERNLCGRVIRTGVVWRFGVGDVNAFFEMGRIKLRGEVGPTGNQAKLKLELQHPQLRPQRLPDLVKQDSRDHLPVEINPCKCSHSWPQQAFAIFNRQLNAVSGLALRVGLAFTSNFWKLCR